MQCDCACARLRIHGVVYDEVFIISQVVVMRRHLAGGGSPMVGDSIYRWCTETKDL